MPLILLEYLKLQLPYSLFLVLIISGGFIVMYAIGFIKYDYDIEIELKELEYAKSKCEYIKYFESVKQFDNEPILTQKSKDKHKKEIKDKINFEED